MDLVAEMQVRHNDINYLSEWAARDLIYCTYSVK